MKKYVTFLVMLIIAAFMYRFADGYYTERRLRFAVWDAIDPAEKDNEPLRKEIMARAQEMRVKVVSSEISFSKEEKDGAMDPSGMIQVVRTIKSVTFPWSYRRFGAEKTGIISVRREVSSKGTVATEGSVPGPTAEP